MILSTDCWETTQVIQDSLLPETKLLFAQFDNQEYLQVEKDSNHIGIQWSGAVAVGDCVRIARETLNDQVFTRGFGKSHLRMIGDKETVDMGTTEALDFVSTRGEDVDFVTLSYELCAITWLSSALKLKTDTVPHTEISYGAKTTNLPKLVEFMRRTATPHVAHALKQSTQPLSVILQK